MNRKPVFFKRSRIRARTPKRAAEEREYRQLAEAFLKKNKWCAVAEALGWLRKKATQVHHKRGRIGRLLLDQRHWLPVSMVGHEWINNNPNEARERGLLCEQGKWNTYEA